MQALKLEHKLIYSDKQPKPEMLPGEALVRLKLAGICATDLELMKGYADFSGILGHEFVGTVVAVADSRDRHWIQRRVVGAINIACHQCEQCVKNIPEHCLQRKVLGIRQKAGVFADYFTLPVENLYQVPDHVPDRHAVFCEPLAAALRVNEQIKALNISQIAVLGPGRLGLLIAKVLGWKGFNVLLLARSEKTLELPKTWQLNTALVNEVAASSFDCVVDASGQAAGFEQALRLVKAQGTLVLKSTFAANSAVDLSKIVVDEINLLGSRCGPFDQALALLAKNYLPLDTMIDGEYPLSEADTAFEHARKPGVRKILLHP